METMKKEFFWIAIAAAAGAFVEYYILSKKGVR
jgi:hypothetical protein